MEKASTLVFTFVYLKLEYELRPETHNKINDDAA
jgi:hypothetical protein